MNVKQTGGSHYECMAYQPIDFILDIKADFPTGCVIKYVSRYEKKNGAEDLQKAIDNITFMKVYKWYEMRLDRDWKAHMIQYETKNHLLEWQACALWALFNGQYDDAIRYIRMLIDEYNKRAAEKKGGSVKRRWTKEELDYVRKNYGSMAVKDIAAHLGRTEGSIVSAVYEYDIPGSRIKRWLPSEMEYLRANYQTHTYKEIAAYLGRDPSCVHHKAMQMKLRKINRSKQ